VAVFFSIRAFWFAPLVLALVPRRALVAAFGTIVVSAPRVLLAFAVAKLLTPLALWLALLVLAFFAVLARISAL
jgi:hypothetical protein